MLSGLPWDQWPLYASAIVFILGFGTIAFFFLLAISAPYGRHARDGWGPGIPAKPGWIVMEAPSPICFALLFFMYGGYTRAVPLILLGLWQLHYVYRAFIFPLRMRGGDKSKPLLTVALAFLFNIANGATNGFALAKLAPHLDNTWLSEPRFIAGLFVFFVGYFINHQSDAILRDLRKPGETGYKIPYGGAYRWVSAPNYLGEIIEWIGFAIAAWTLPGWAFAYFTACNLIPRALDHHRWYRDKFDDYPESRRAVIPHIL